MIKSGAAITTRNLIMTMIVTSVDFV